MIDINKMIELFLHNIGIHDSFLEGIIEKVIRKAKLCSLCFGDGHDQQHIFRTFKNAILIWRNTGGDLIVLTISCLLHDLHRHIDKNKYISPRESISMVMDILNSLQELSENQKRKICDAIISHEDYTFGKDKPTATDIEALILQDADNLDAIGAIGIGRAFAYGAIHKLPEYDISIPFYENEYSEMNIEASTLHHIKNKLLRIQDTLHTDVAKKIAYSRTLFLQSFLEHYLTEIDQLPQNIIYAK